MDTKLALSLTSFGKDVIKIIFSLLDLDDQYILARTCKLTYSIFLDIIKSCGKAFHIDNITIRPKYYHDFKMYTLYQKMADAIGEPYRNYAFNVTYNGGIRMELNNILEDGTLRFCYDGFTESSIISLCTNINAISPKKYKHVKFNCINIKNLIDIICDYESSWVKLDFDKGEINVGVELEVFDISKLGDLGKYGVTKLGLHDTSIINTDYGGLANIKHLEIIDYPEPEHIIKGCTSLERLDILNQSWHIRNLNELVDINHELKYIKYECTINDLLRVFSGGISLDTLEYISCTNTLEEYTKNKLIKVNNLILQNNESSYISTDNLIIILKELIDYKSITVLPDEG